MVEGKEKKLGFQVLEKDRHMEYEIIIAEDRAQKRVTNIFFKNQADIGSDKLEESHLPGTGISVHLAG